MGTFVEKRTSDRPYEDGYGTNEPGPATNYEAVVPKHVRDHAESLMSRWREEGRSDQVIDTLVRSLVLAAYAQGWKNGLGAAQEAVAAL